MGAALVSQLSFGQSVPVPEYYGVYAVVDGKLLKLDVEELHADKLATIRMGERMGVGDVVQHQPATAPPKSIQIPEFPADLKIVVYAQSGGLQSPLEIAKTLQIESLVFVRMLTIDSGWPNQIKRSDPENGWDSGEAVELGVVAGGENAHEPEFLVKPMPGQRDMVIAGLQDKLKPGVYRLKVGQGGMLIAVQPIAQAESGKCVDALITYNMMMSNTKYTSCAGAAVNTPAPSSGDTSGGTTGGGNAATAFCNSYDACFQAGMAAYRTNDWPAATANFHAAAGLRRASGEPYIWLGRILFMDNQPHQQSDLSDVWDKALSLGSQIMIGACHELTLRSCERGDLALSAKDVAFLANGSQAVFSAAPAEITPGRILNNPAAMHVSYSMKLANKNYAIDFIPLGTEGCQFNLMVQCPPEGITKQQVLAQYVSQTLPRLANGTLAAKIAPPATPGKSVCDKGAEAGYAILLQGHLYKVRLSGSAGPDQTPYFFDEKGTQVTDVLLLTQLAAALWTRDNVIASPDARNGSLRVSDILGTSKALQTYTTVQDVVSRAMVEAVEAGFTGGGSLAKAVPNVTLGALKSQLTNAPKTLLVLTAQHGLEASLAAYKQMEAVPLPPQDATALNATELARLRDLYVQARSLELPYEALAAKLMPTSGSELTQQALKSALGELTGGPLFSGAANSAVTLQNLLDLQKGIANLAKSLPALQGYSENLNLAKNLTAVNSQTISKWASAAGQKCN
jgi:hypothetical protein